MDALRWPQESGKLTRRAVTYNILVCGQSGLGKSTFVRTLLADSSFIPREDDKPKDLGNVKTTEIRVYSSEVELDTGKVNLSIIDTQGFGDAINNTKAVDTVVNYVQDQFRAYLAEESRVKRNPKFLDPRVHVVLYFIPPTLQGLSELDKKFLRSIGSYSNVIPVIGKADTLNEDELKAVKAKIVSQIAAEKISCFDFPDIEGADAEEVELNRQLRATIPFAVIGSEQLHDVNGKKVRGRRYPWGIVDIENPLYSDYVKLRDVLIKTHVNDLKEVTDIVLYERFREQDLAKSTKKEKKAKDAKEAESVPVTPTTA